MSMISTQLTRNLPYEFKDEQGRALPPRVNKAARAYVHGAYGGAKPTAEDASILKQHMRGGGGRIKPRKAKHLNRDAD